MIKLSPTVLRNHLIPLIIITAEVIVLDLPLDRIFKFSLLVSFRQVQQCLRIKSQTYYHIYFSLFITFCVGELFMNDVSLGIVQLINSYCRHLDLYSFGENSVIIDLETFYLEIVAIVEIFGAEHGDQTEVYSIPFHMLFNF